MNSRSNPVRLPIFAMIVAAVASIAIAPVLMAQDLHPSRSPSPMGMARTFVGDAYVFVVYSRPYERGRDVIIGAEDDGALVPYGKIWRTGANAATQITVTEDVMVAGNKLAAGTYSLFTVPGPESWAVHFVSQLGMSGTGMFADGQFKAVDIPAETVLKVDAKAMTHGDDHEKVDQFTISFDGQDDGSTHMVLAWIHTEVRVPISAAGGM